MYCRGVGSESSSSGDEAALLCVEVSVLMDLVPEGEHLKDVSRDGRNRPQSVPPASKTRTNVQMTNVHAFRENPLAVSQEIKDMPPGLLVTVIAAQVHPPPVPCRKITPASW